jgi:hypothetical protein
MTGVKAVRYSDSAMNGLQYRRAFVIQFRAEYPGDQGPLAGRVEHVASGRTMNFCNSSELPQILEQMLKASQSDNGDL